MFAFSNSLLIECTAAYAELYVGGNNKCGWIRGELLVVSWHNLLILVHFFQRFLTGRDVKPRWSNVNSACQDSVCYCDLLPRVQFCICKQFSVEPRPVYLDNHAIHCDLHFEIGHGGHRFPSHPSVLSICIIKRDEENIYALLWL